MAKSTKKKQMNPKKATNIVAMAVAVLTIWYLVVAWFLLIRNTNRMTEKLNKINSLNSGNVTAEYFLRTGMDIKQIKQACFQKNCFDVELATDTDSRQVWLMNRINLDINKGMLFIFEKSAIHKFWMKNTLIALDMIWLDEKMEIIYIEHNVKPCKAVDHYKENCPSYWPNQNSRYVLEINGGLAKMMMLKVGDVLNFGLR